MDIRIKNISIRNFKGLVKLSVDFNGNNTSIYGDNATGKTSLYDSFTWLLFNKDSKKRTDFNMKSLGVERPEVEVEITFLVDGEELVLKKVLRELWVKKRNTGGEETFSGHETKYYVNGMERTMGAFNSYMASLKSEEVFRMVTSSEYFLSMERSAMRKLLVEKAGEFDSEDCFKDDADALKLHNFITQKGYSVDDVTKLAKQHKAAYNAEKESISVRVDEVNRTRPEYNAGDHTKATEGMAAARSELKRVDDKLSSARYAVLSAEKAAGEIADLEGNIRRYRIAMLDSANKGNEQAKGDVAVIGQNITSLKRKAESMATQEDFLTAEIKQEKEDHARQQQRYKDLDKKRRETAETTFEPIVAGSLKCKACGQDLPVDSIEKINEEQKVVVEQNKANELKDFDTALAQAKERGEALKELIQKKTQGLTTLAADLEQAYHEISVSEAALVDAQEQLKLHPRADDVDLTADPEYIRMSQELASKRESLVNPVDNSQELQEYRKKIEGYIERFNKMLSVKDDIAKADTRLKELETRSVELSGLIGIEEKRLDICERYITQTAKYSSNKINSMFGAVSFRLFKRQINGDIVNDCTPMVMTKDGPVELEKNGSNSEGIRAGLDIIKAMQRFEDIKMPIFVDNAEAATTLIPMDCQLIRLVVSEPDKKLRVVIDKEGEKGEIKKAKKEPPEASDLNQIDLSEFL